MKIIRIGLILISLLLITSLICITSNSLETETIRDVIIAPALVISLYLIFKKQEK